MAEKLTYSHRIAAGWRVEYKLTEDGSEMSVIAGAGWAKHELTEPRDLDALHEALHTAKKAAVALDGVGVETLGWGGEQPDPAPDDGESRVDISEATIEAESGSKHALAMDLLHWLAEEHRVASYHEAFQELYEGGLLTHRGGDDYAISDEGRAVLAEQAG